MIIFPSVEEFIVPVDLKISFSSVRGQERDLSKKAAATPGCGGHR